MIPDLFSKLRAENRKALMPFVTAGDPDLEFTAAVLKEVVSRGASLCEVGIPYSDPIADGRTWTGACSRDRQAPRPARRAPGPAAPRRPPSASLSRLGMSSRFRSRV